MLTGRKFDHECNTTKTRDEVSRHILVQDGIRYTNAEFNRFTNKWEPEPREIGPVNATKEMLIPKLVDFIERVQALEEEVFKLMPSINLVLNSMTPPETEEICEWCGKSFKNLGAHKRHCKEKPNGEQDQN